jgi:flagellar hook-basal body complex protein FliE
MLGDAIGRVQAFQQNATDTVNRFLSGEGGEVHTAALAVERAELAFDMFLQVRNKVVAAYEQIMQTQM